MRGVLVTAVLVTGATTPLGRALVEALLATPRTRAVLAVAREPSSIGTADSRLHCVQCDLTRSRDVRDLLSGPTRQLGITRVAHLAHHRSVRTHGRDAHALNVDATRELLELAEDHDTIERFVYVGSAEVYRVDPGLPSIVSERHPIELARAMPQRLRDRVEADLTVCARMGLSRNLRIAVLRLAELFAPESGSQLHDYLASRVCYRPAGFDPMLQVISIDDAERAIRAALERDAEGVFNVPGADVLPLSAAITAARRVSIPVPGPFVGPLYAARAAIRGTDFDWTLNRWRFRWSAVLDGQRARDLLGYTPRSRVTWDDVPVVRTFRPSRGFGVAAELQ